MLAGKKPTTNLSEGKAIELFARKVGSMPIFRLRIDGFTGLAQRPHSPKILGRLSLPPPYTCG
jgi:hypothetical protein